MKLIAFVSRITTTSKSHFSAQGAEVGAEGGARKAHVELYTPKEWAKRTRPISDHDPLSPIACGHMDLLWEPLPAGGSHFEIEIPE